MTNATLNQSEKEAVRSLRNRAVAVAAMLFFVAIAPAAVAEDASQRAEIDAFIKAGDLDEAAERLSAIDDLKPEDQDLTLQLARLARAFQQADQRDEAAKFFQRSVAASMRPAAKSLAAKKITLVHLAAGSAMVQAGMPDQAVECFSRAFDPNSEATEPQKKFAVKLCLQIGAKALAENGTETAAIAYALAADHAQDDDRATAMLGVAWAAAIAEADPTDAARKLAAFVDEFPEHSDAPQALRACAECLKRAGRPDDSSQVLADLLDRWTDSDAAIAVIKSYCDRAVVAVPDAVLDWLMTKSKANQVAGFDSKMTVLGLIVAAQRDEIDAWNHLAVQLSTADNTGQATSDLLQHFVDANQSADAERLAASMIAGDHPAAAGATAREAACRWAARTQRWSMLALTGEAESTESESETRTVTIERLFAEALIQTGRASESHRWWQHLVDVRGVSDFATLLRCGETSVAIDEVEVASKRIEAARAAAADNKFRVSLVDMLAAELSIRRLRFDEARSLLENVVRSDETDRGLRGRAQWLIGETFYLQQQFADAIEAYRRVEGIDPGGTWVAASLVQAGKSFEQLGRTRDAAVCYSGLVSRFADSQHTQLARSRLAQIAPESKPASPTDSNPTLRR